MFNGKYYLSRFAPFVLVYFLVEAIEGVGLSIYEYKNIDLGFLSILATLGIFFQEVCIGCLYWLLPYSFYLMILPKKYVGSRLDRILTMTYFSIFVLISVFEEISEVFFWEEFSSTFNFIAVDYLIYTKEVIGNIWESYPMIPILLGIVLIASFVCIVCNRFLVSALNVPRFKMRLLLFVSHIALLIISFFSFDISDADIISNHYNKEIAKDGAFAFCSAFLKNNLSFEDYYITSNLNKLSLKLRQDLQQENSTYLEQAPSVRRHIQGKGEEKRLNVVVVIMESMGAEFMNENRRDHLSLTPCLSQLSQEGVYFPHVYASGTRSVRGLEALSASLPPLPGMSIVRREHNEGIENVGTVFNKKGYAVQWVYGGYGYFDNMNYYFGNNGFTTYDRTTVDKSQIQHETIWGICDEDLFKRSIKEASMEYEKGVPFMQFVFTTSNHRPYTYPEGKIDIPSKTGRYGAVKYADFAVGQLIKMAKEQPWFDDTVFVFVADHGAGAAGKKDLNPDKHLIPLIIYSPKHIVPQRYEKNISQIDVMPTVLGLLNFSYDTSCYGKDALSENYKSRYFISNYQQVGYGSGERLLILKPVKKAEMWENDKKTTEQVSDAFVDCALMYYQHASHWEKFLHISK